MSPRSLVSEVEQSSDGRAWGRSFDSLRQRVNKLSNDKSKPPSVDSWFGKVAIARGVSDPVSQSHESKKTFKKKQKDLARLDGPARIRAPTAPGKIWSSDSSQPSADLTIG